ncbi:MAG: transcriptional regulator [Candidatus Kariarchaeaceae archaeon]|jgi:predicted Zn-ribbon and HTH transcriptional regulator
MTREEVIEYLKENSATAVDLSKEFAKSSAGIEEDLNHIRTSLRNDPEHQLLIRPAECLLCGYVFSTDKPKAPSKCPQCQEQKIRLPSFKIEKR